MEKLTICVKKEKENTCFSLQFYEFELLHVLGILEKRTETNRLKKFPLSLVPIIHKALKKISHDQMSTVI